MRFRNFHAGCCGYVPTRADGSEWSHVLTLRDSSTVYADTVDEVLDEVIAGWSTLPADEQAEALVRHADVAAQEAQRLRIADATSRGTFDPADPDDRGLLVVLEADKQLSLLLETPDAPGAQADWLAPVDLVLLTTSYAPHGEHPPIGGRTVWLDPSNPAAYLASLRDSGSYDYWTLSTPGSA
ncbi:hypothetical protein [Mobilicoccus massiliensis]|uniref:hypothetical protein n=1 Tax=Mobilicoccus massiliensis TaxID=1522310 RepID=UPI0005906CD4|nr:hypothetical protein [Mobilicoccus massiliensis]